MSSGSGSAGTGSLGLGLGTKSATSGLGAPAHSNGGGLAASAPTHGAFQSTNSLKVPLPNLSAGLAAPALSNTRQSSSYGSSYSAPQQSYGPIEAAIQSRRTVELREVAYPDDYVQPQVIEVGAGQLPVQIHFKSASSPLTVKQSHTPGYQSPVEYGSYRDEPHRLVNEVTKPVIQEVREVIQPYRRVTQEIRPVMEEVHTLVHKGQRKAYEPLPLKQAAAGYGSGAAMAPNKGYKAAKAA